MIEVKNVSKYFGQVKAVDDISFDVAEGERLILLGTSGCGKTTTLRMINRLTEPSEGIIKVDGENVLTQSPEKLRRGIGYVLQHHGLFPHYTIAENIEVVPSLLKWNTTKKQQRTKEILEQLHLPYETHKNLYPSQLSGGQQQRVGVARALAANPPVLLMDEPFGALDAVTRTEIRKELLQLEAFKKKTIIMVTHDIQEAFAYGNRICLMDKGKIVQAGTPQELLFHPVNKFVTNFLAEQHLQLELNAIILQKIWPYLPSDQHDKEDISLTQDNNIWQAMELLTNKTNNASISIHHTMRNEIKRIDLSTLLQAFSEYKASQL
jgi:osmoprotectant transport system ATP-binding protein